MKLELDLVRELLLYVEEKAERPISELESIQIAPWTDDQITYHVIRLQEAGLIVAHIDTLPDEEDPSILHVDYRVNSLTFNGHEFLGTVRTPKHWLAIKQNAERAGKVGIKTLGKIAEAYMDSVIGQMFGN